MRPSFVAGFGPIVREPEVSLTFWSGDLGIELHEAAPDYWATEDLEGVNAFALWPLAQAAAACFGTPTWPADLPIPQAWIEFDVESVHAVVRGAHEEPWGQTTARLLSPEGLLVGITYTPSMHKGPGGESSQTSA